MSKFIQLVPFPRLDTIAALDSEGLVWVWSDSSGYWYRLEDDTETRDDGGEPNVA